MAEPARTPSEVFGDQVRATRTRKGWTSQQRLADEMRALGVASLDRSAVGRMETGDRSIKLDEALAVAAALEVTPLALMFPPTGRVAVAPKLRVSAEDARAWVRGYQPLPQQDARFYEREQEAWPESWIDSRAEPAVRLVRALNEAWTAADVEAVEATLDALAAELKRQRVEVSRLKREG